MTRPAELAASHPSTASDERKTDLDHNGQHRTEPDPVALAEIGHAWHRVHYGIGTERDPSTRMGMLHALGGVLTIMEHHGSGVVAASERRIAVQIARDRSHVTDRYLAPAIEAQVLRVVDPGRGIGQVDWSDSSDDVRSQMLGLRDPDAIDGGRSRIQEHSARIEAETNQLAGARPDGSLIGEDHDGLTLVDTSDVEDQAPWLSEHRRFEPFTEIGAKSLWLAHARVDSLAVVRGERFLQLEKTGSRSVPEGLGPNIGEVQKVAPSEGRGVLAPSPVSYETWADAWTEAEAGAAGWVVACSVVTWGRLAPGPLDREDLVTPSGLVKRFGGRQQSWSSRLASWVERGYAEKVKRGTYRLLFVEQWRSGVLSTDRRAVALFEQYASDQRTMAGFRHKPKGATPRPGRVRALTEAAQAL